MNKKKNYVTKLTIILLICILFITSVGIENVSAFWNNDNPAFGDRRQLASITIQLMHCTHTKSDNTHWVNNKHITDITADTVISEHIVYPGVLGDTQAGLESIDTNKYFYEYSLTYAESELVDYVLITQPEITHYSDSDSKRPADLREEHVRMYWIGSYNKSMTEVTGKWTGNGYDENDTDIGWYDFKNESFPSIDSSLSQQTWETIGDHEAFQNNKSFVFTKKMGENGMEFIYLLEGTKTVNANDGSFLDITGGIYDYLKSADASTVDKAERRYNKTYTSSGEPNASADPGFNHRDQSHDGRPLGYGEHVNAVIGIVFYNTVDFDANGGTFDEGSVYTMQTYSESKQCRVIPWYSNLDKSTWYSDIDVSNPQVSTQYGNISVKAPTRPGYEFLGWYAAKTGSDGSIVRDSDGNIQLTDIPVYDLDGKAVLTYTDSSGNTKASPYFDRNGSWIYKGNVTAAARWKYIGAYSIRYSKGASNSNSVMPDSTSATLGSAVPVADGSYIEGSDYTVDFITWTNCGTTSPDSIPSIRSRFSFSYWDIEGGKYNGVSTSDDIKTEFYRADAAEGSIFTAAAKYDDFTGTLPQASCAGYELEGWYSAYNAKTGTFKAEDRVGDPGGTYTVKTSGNSVYRAFYANWVKSGSRIYFDPFLCDECGKYGSTSQKTINATAGKYSARVSSGIKGASIDSLHGFAGWYDADGVQVYNGSGNAATASSKYWTADPSGNPVWNYREDIIVYAHYSEDYYIIHYDKGESDNSVSMPADAAVMEGGGTTLADGRIYGGSGYIASFDTNVEPDTTSFASIPNAVLGNFPFLHWDIEGSAYGENGKNLYYEKPGAGNKEVITATAVYTDAAVTLPSTSRRGYEFRGWYRDKECTDFAGNAGDRTSIPVSATSIEVIFYAKWEKGFTDIAFDYNVPDTAKKSILGYALSGNGTSSKRVQYFAPLGTLPSPTLTGYRLSVNNLSDGWSTMPNLSDGTQVSSPVTAATAYDGSYDTLYAQWEPVSYFIRYDYDGGSVSRNNPIEAGYYEEITVCSPARAGSTFLGWEITGMDGNRHLIDGTLTGTGVTSGSGAGKGKTSIKMMGLRADSKTVTLTAVWKDTQYPITYDYRDAENGDRLTPDSDVGNPTSYTVSTPTFTLKNPSVKGYSLSGWEGTEITGRIPTVTVQNGNTGDRTYTAYYKPEEYEIAYDLCGGTWEENASHPSSAKYNRTFTVSAPVLNGCTFEGWEITDMSDDCTHIIGNTSVTGSTASGITATSFMNLRSRGGIKVRFKAVWSHAVYSIQYDFNGGSAYAGVSYPESAETYTSFNITNPERSGWTFAGWTVTGMDDALHYLPNGNTTSESSFSEGAGKASGTNLLYGNLRYSPGTVKLTAAWERDDRQIVFFGNGGIMMGDSMQGNTHNTADDISGSISSISNGAGITQGEWTMRFIKFGSTDFNKRSEYGTYWGTDVPSVSKTGYKFEGYYDALTGGSAAYDGSYNKISGLYWDDSSRFIGPSLILYARFTPKDFNVTFDANGGCWSSDDSQDDRTLGVTYDSTKNNKAYGRTDIYRPGYTFGGWTTSPDGTGPGVYDADGYNTADGGYWSRDYRK